MSARTPRPARGSRAISSWRTSGRRRPRDGTREKPAGIPSNRCLRELTAVRNDNGLLGGTAAAAHGLAGGDDLHALNNLTENGVLAVKPGGHNGGDEELGPVGVGAGVGHGQEPGLVVLLDEVLVGELGAVDGLTAGAVPRGEVAALAHELGDDAVELGALVVQGLAGLADALLTSAKRPEVLRALRGDVREELWAVTQEVCGAEESVRDFRETCEKAVP